MTNKEIRDKYRNKGNGHDNNYDGSEVNEIQDATRLDTLTTMRNLELWNSTETPEEKIQHFFKVVDEAIKLIK